MKIMHWEGCHSRGLDLPSPEQRGRTPGASTRRGGGGGGVINLIAADSVVFHAGLNQRFPRTESAKTNKNPEPNSS